MLIISGPCLYNLFDLVFLIQLICHLQTIFYDIFTLSLSSLEDHYYVPRSWSCVAHTLALFVYQFGDYSADRCAVQQRLANEK